MLFVVIGVNCTVLFASSGGAGECDANATEEDYAEREREREREICLRLCECAGSECKGVIRNWRRVISRGNCRGL
jgi:hypothetical protein